MVAPRASAGTLKSADAFAVSVSFFAVAYVRPTRERQEAVAVNVEASD